MKLERAIDAVQFLCRIVVEDSTTGVSKQTVQEIRDWLGAAIGNPGDDIHINASSFIKPLLVEKN